MAVCRPPLWTAWIFFLDDVKTIGHYMARGRGKYFFFKSKGERGDLLRQGRTTQDTWREGMAAMLVVENAMLVEE